MVGRAKSVSATLVTFIVISLFVSSYFTDPFRTMRQYLPIFAALYVFAELGWLVGVGMMVHYSGSARLSWKAVTTFNIDKREFDWHNPGVVTGLWLSRFTWIMPFAYLLIAGWARLPSPTLIAAAVEVINTLAIGVAIMSLIGAPKDKYIIRPAVAEDVSGILRVDEAVWGAIMPGNQEMFLSRIQVFPKGGLVVAERDRQIVAFGSVQLIEGLQFPADLTWDEATDHGTIQATHRPDGDWLYGVGLAAMPDANGAAEKIATYFVQLSVLTNKKGVVLAARIPGYQAYSKRFGAADPTEYVLSQHHGKPRDPELRIYFSYGLSVLAPPVILKNYMPEGSDPKSCDYSVLVKWNNPLYGWPKPVRWVMGHLISASPPKKMEETNHELAPAK